ncbi:molybdopterin-binding oxidoreductase, partial [Streptomyces sp. NPDC006446]
MRYSLGAIGGVLAGFAALAVAEAVSALVRPEAGPVVAVGGAAIDRTPPSVKDWAIRHFGTDDKLVLQLGILVVLALFACALGVLAVRRRRAGALGVLLFGVIGGAAALTRPDSTSWTDALPSATGALCGALFLYALAGRLSTTRPTRPTRPAPSAPDSRPDRDEPVAAEGDAAPAATPGEPGWDRRGFIVAATA